LEVQASTAGRIFIVGFFIIWIAGTISMGFFFIDFANSWPDWGPGPSPSLFVWIPFAMAGFGALILALNVYRWVKPSRMAVPERGYSTMESPYQGGRFASTQASGYREPAMSYEVQPYCSQCGAKLDSELVEWVGPISYKCPSCGHTHKAEARYF
jgi:predicted RNA-binding Zn-ribbon protein involved in translation (DUF1610 family)